MIELVKRIAKLAFKPKNTLQKIYNSYDEALKDCGPGYDDSIIPDVILKKTERVIAEIKKQPFLSPDTVISSELISIFLLNKNNINVVDIGGACGLHYFICKAILGDKIQFNWNVVETKSMAVRGASLATSELNFFDGLDNIILNHIDLIISSGTIQYIPDPRAFLLKITALNANYILLTRLSLSVVDKDIITIQPSLLSENGNGPLPDGYQDSEVKYVHTNMSEKDFNDIITVKYTPVLKFREESGIHPVNDEQMTGYGVLFKKK